MSLSVGVDVGGTTSTIAIGDSRAQVLCVSDQFATRSEEGPAVTVADIVRQIEIELERLGRSVDDVAAISLATPGPATIDGVLLRSPNLDPRYWDRCPIRQQLQDAFATLASGVQVCYVGDGQAAALGEYATRTGLIRWNEVKPPELESTSQFRSLFMVAVGTGFGGGEVREGAIVRGCKGRAGHAGHLMLPADAFRYQHDRRLKVGNAYSTVESAVSLTALTHQLQYRLELPQWKSHPLNEQPGTVRDKAKRLRELAAEGDALAEQLFEDQARALGISLLMINYIGDYDMLVVGGGVCDLNASLRERYLQVARQSYLDHALDGFRDDVAIDFSACGDHASVIGSLYHAYR